MSPTYGDARCGGEVRRIGRPRNGPRGWPMTGSQNRASFTPGQMRALPSDTQGGSRMPESGPYGSVRGARGNSRPYRDHRWTCSFARPVAIDIRQLQDGTVKKGLHRPRLSAIIPNLTAAGSHPDCRAVLIQIVALYRPVHHTDRCLLQRHVQSDIVVHRRSPSLRGRMRLAPYLSGELIERSR